MRLANSWSAPCKLPVCALQTGPPDCQHFTKSPENAELLVNFLYKAGRACVSDFVAQFGPVPIPCLLRAPVYIYNKVFPVPVRSPAAPPRELPSVRFPPSSSHSRPFPRPNYVHFVMISEILSLFLKFPPQKVCGLGNYPYLCIRFRENFPSAALEADL